MPVCEIMGTGVMGLVKLKGCRRVTARYDLLGHKCLCVGHEGSCLESEDTRPSAQALQSIWSVGALSKVISKKQQQDHGE